MTVERIFTRPAHVALAISLPSARSLTSLPSSEQLAVTSVSHDVLLVLPSDWRL